MSETREYDQSARLTARGGWEPPGRPGAAGRGAPGREATCRGKSFSGKAGPGRETQKRCDHPSLRPAGPPPFPQSRFQREGPFYIGDWARGPAAPPLPSRSARRQNPPSRNGIRSHRGRFRWIPPVRRTPCHSRRATTTTDDTRRLREGMREGGVNPEHFINCIWSPVQNGHVPPQMPAWTDPGGTRTACEEVARCPPERRGQAAAPGRRRGAEPQAQQGVLPNPRKKRAAGRPAGATRARWGVRGVKRTLPLRFPDSGSEEGRGWSGDGTAENPSPTGHLQSLTRRVKASNH